MNKLILIYVSPQEACNILTGKQTALLRKRIPKDYKGWVYGNVSEKKPHLAKMGLKRNQTIPFRFWCDEYETIITKTIYYQTESGMEEDIMYDISKEQLSKINMPYSAVEDYGNYKEDKNGFIKTLYLMHIKKLEIFDKPMQLSEFYIVNKDVREVGAFGHLFNEEELPNYVKLSKPPKNYQYVYVKEKENGRTN